MKRTNDFGLVVGILLDAILKKSVSSAKLSFFKLIFRKLPTTKFLHKSENRRNYGVGRTGNGREGRFTQKAFFELWGLISQPESTLEN